MSCQYLSRLPEVEGVSKSAIEVVVLVSVGEELSPEGTRGGGLCSPVAFIGRHGNEKGV